MKCLFSHSLIMVMLDFGGDGGGGIEERGEQAMESQTCKSSASYYV